MGLPDGTDQVIAPTVINNVLLLWIDVYNALGDIDYDGLFEGVCEGGTKTLSPAWDDGNSYTINDGKVFIVIISLEVIYEAISYETMIDDVKWIEFCGTRTMVTNRLS